MTRVVTRRPLALRRVAAWRYVSRQLVEDGSALLAVARDLFDYDIVEEQAHLQALEVRGPVDVVLTQDHADAWVQNLYVLLVEVECVELPHRVARSRWRRGRRWAADRAYRVRRVFSR